ncbi:MAG: efflux RND transporter periplasmic adaptor subunit [Pseudomonadota bacterium]
MNKTKRATQFLLVVLFLSGGAFGLAKLTADRPEAEKRRPEILAPLARVFEVQKGAFPITVIGQGTVRPMKEVGLAPQVSGRLTFVSPALVNGGAFSKGDLLLAIDQADYRLAVEAAKAKLSGAQARYEVADNDFKRAKSLLPRNVISTEKFESTEAEYKNALSNLETARNELQKAALNLTRTEIQAPFEGRTSQENVEVGHYAAPGVPVATLFSVETAEIVVPLEDEELRWFHVPGFTPGKGPGSKVVVKGRIAGREISRRGQVARVEGQINERTRMVNVVVRVDRPYSETPPLAMGLFVSVEIEGLILPDAAAIPREALRQGDLVYVVDPPGTLRFRPVRIARRQGDKILIEQGLNHGDLAVTSRLKTPTDGMKVRLAADDKAD